MQYRREIDGLRAVAVVPVILFHAGFAPFAGGYVGVDVFFVISGYLITSILIADLERGRFSIARFYERRARRILPALFFMMACCLPFALAWMMPSQLKDFGQALVAVSLFASNILFWKKTDYFAPAAEENPLLHTWSLAVEEQFYIVFPVLLLVLWRFGRNPVLGVIVVLSLASLALSEWGWRNKPDANFYLIVSRAWELGAGSICAFLLHGRPVRANAALSALGLGLILFSVVAFDGETPFPSLYALAPVGGTALIILFAGAGTPVARLLSLPAFVGIGLISYSAYLWHQPLFAFARIRSFGHVEDWLMLVLATASLGLGWASWRYVERPFRQGGGWLPRQAGVFAASGAGMAAFIALGLAGHTTNGFFVLKTSGEQMALLQSAQRSPLREFCHESETSGRPSDTACTYHDGLVRWAVLGNSHGVELAYALADALQPRNEALMHLTISSCRPVFGLAEELGFCGRWSDDAVHRIATDPEIEHVVLSYRTLWSTEAMIGAYMDMARFLHTAGKTVVLVLEAPRLPTYMERLVHLRPVDAQGNIPGQARADALAETSDVRTAVRQLPPGVIVIDPAETFCDQTTCYGVLGRRALFFDDHHMSLHGAALVAGQILSDVDRRHVAGP